MEFGVHFRFTDVGLYVPFWFEILQIIALLTNSNRLYYTTVWFFWKEYWHKSKDPIGCYKGKIKPPFCSTKPLYFFYLWWVLLQRFLSISSAWGTSFLIFFFFLCPRVLNLKSGIFYRKQTTIDSCSELMDINLVRFYVHPFSYWFKLLHILSNSISFRFVFICFVFEKNDGLRKSVFKR